MSPFLTHRSVFVLSLFALQVLGESKIMKKIFFMNELVRLGVSNLVGVFFKSTSGCKSQSPRQWLSQRKQN